MPGPPGRSAGTYTPAGRDGERRAGRERAACHAGAMLDPTLNRPCGGRYGNMIEAVGNTPLVELPRLSPKPEVRIFAKLEGLARPARSRTGWRRR